MVGEFMKNIAIIIYSLKGGGAERVASLLSHELSKTYNLYIIVYDSDDIAYNHSGMLIDLDVKSHDNKFIKALNVFKRVLKTKKIKRELKIDVSISFLGSANIINILSGTKDKKIVSVHSNKATGKSKFIGMLNQMIYNKSDRIICVSKGISNNLIKNYKLENKNVDTIYNPLNMNEIKGLLDEKISEQNIFEGNQFTIVNMGRLTGAKGQWHLIRALTYVKKEIKNIKLLILGDGELEDYLKDLVIDLRLEEYVIFLGYKTNPFKYVNKSDLLTMSSLYEGFGNVIIEAMACGIPVISTDCRFGPREILAPKTNINKESREIEYEEYGVLVPVPDGSYYDYKDPLTREEKLLARSIIDLYNNKKRDIYSIKGKVRAKEFDVKNIMKQWELNI